MAADKKITVEIRSLNSKQLDLAVKMPGIYRQFEYDIRNKAAKALQRGKVDIYINLERSASAPVANVNKELFMSYYSTLRELSHNIEGGDDNIVGSMVSSILRMPEVVSTDNNDVSEEEKTALTSAVDHALAHIDEFRQQEGQTLINDLLQRIDRIQSYKEDIIPFEKRRIDTIKERIRESIAQLNLKADENRLEQEMIFYVEKLDITEEKVRLDNHCRYFREVAGEEDNAGRKLGFISQEIGREINTIGSKANDSDIQQTVVRMKDELEKIKEQLLNIL